MYQAVRQWLVFRASHIEKVEAPSHPWRRCRPSMVSTVARRRGGAAVGLALVSWVGVLIVFARVYARVCTFLM